MNMNNVFINYLFENKKINFLADESMAVGVIMAVIYLLTKSGDNGQ